MSETVATGGEGTSHYQPQGDRVDVIAHYPERIRIDRTTDTGRFLGPFDADRTNGRPDMDSCIYVRADLHRGAVEARDALAKLVREIRSELVAPSGHPVTSAPWCARVIARIDATLGGQSSPAGCPACSPDPKTARPPHTCSGEQS